MATRNAFCACRPTSTVGTQASSEKLSELSPKPLNIARGGGLVMISGTSAAASTSKRMTCSGSESGATPTSMS